MVKKEGECRTTAVASAAVTSAAVSSAATLSASGAFMLLPVDKLCMPADRRAARLEEPLEVLVRLALEVEAEGPPRNDDQRNRRQRRAAPSHIAEAEALHPRSRRADEDHHRLAAARRLPAEHVPAGREGAQRIELSRAKLESRQQPPLGRDVPLLLNQARRTTATCHKRNRLDG